MSAAFTVPAAPAFGGSGGTGSMSGSGSPGAAQSPATDDIFADPIAGGGTDDQAFSCPGCGRTLSRGMRRCEGCGKRFVMDLPVRRAAMLGGVGIVVAVVAGVLVMNLFGTHAAAPQAGDTAVGLGGVTAVQPGSNIPAGALAALRGTTTINGRLAAEAALLSKAVRAKSFRTSDVVKILRRMAIDARAGTAMLRPMTAWADASDHQAALATFYNQLARRIDTGLSASVSSAKAYKKSAKSVLATLGAVPGLDTGARTLAGASGVELPAVTIPAALR